MQYIKYYFANRQPLWRFAFWFALANAMLCWLIGIRFLTIILASKTLFATSFYAYTSVFGKVFVLVFAAISFLGHLSLLAFLPIYLIVLPLILLINQRQTVFAVAIVLSAMIAVILLIDSYVFNYFHFHLNLVLLKIAF